jgi:hypothetical protein
VNPYIIAAKFAIVLAKYGDSKNQIALNTTIAAIANIVSKDTPEHVEAFKKRLDSTATIVDLYFSTIADLAKKGVGTSEAGTSTITALPTHMLSPAIQTEVKAAIYHRFGNTKKASQYKATLQAMKGNLAKLQARVDRNTKDDKQPEAPKDDNKVLFAAGAGLLVLLLILRK